MTTRRHWISMVAAALGLVPPASAGEPILVQVPASFDARAPVSNTVRSECGLETLLGNDVLEGVKAKFPESTPVQKSTATEKQKVLNVTILSVSAPGGGVWSGGKSMTIRADLIQSGRIIATTVKERGSRGGALGGFKGTCGILERVTAALGKDIAAWLSQTLVLGGGAQGAATTAEPQNAGENEPAQAKTE